MKLTQIGRITKAAALSMAIILGMTACNEDYTIAYLYVTASRAISNSNPDGYISAYKVDNQSGSLTQLADSPYSSGGTNPVAVVLSPNNQALYVINHDNSTIVEFLIGTDGKIYPNNTYNLGPSGTAGTYPVAATIDPTNTYLIVAFTYQLNYTPLNPGPGGFAVFKINSDNSLNSTPLMNGTHPYFYLGNNPSAIGISPQAQTWRANTIFTVGQTVWDGTNVELATTGGTSGGGSPSWNATVNGNTTDGSVTWKNVSPVYSYIYAVDQERTGGQLLGFLLTDASGSPAISTLQGTTDTSTIHTGYTAGTVPHAIAEDPTGRFVYLTDQSANQLIGYVVQPGGWLQQMVNSPFTTGLYPQGITVDPRGEFVYVTNYNSSSLSGYAINLSSGALSTVFSNGTAGTGTAPTCITIEPAFGIYLFTSNFIDNTVSGFQMDPHTGALAGIQNSPFNAAANPTCAVTAAAGSHAYQAVQP